MEEIPEDVQIGLGEGDAHFEPCLAFLDAVGQTTHCARCGYAKTLHVAQAKVANANS